MAPVMSVSVWLTMLKAVDTQTRVTVTADSIRITTNRGDCGLSCFLKEGSAAPCGLFVYPGRHQTLSTCAGCLLIAPPGGRTPCLIDRGASLACRSCVETEVVAVLCTCQHSTLIYMEEGEGAWVAMLPLASWHRWPSFTPTALDTE